MSKLSISSSLAVFTLLITISTYPVALACTAAYHAPSHMMLKSYDWDDGSGDLYFNPRGLKREALPHEAARGLTESVPHQWRARFASVSFNQYGRGFPNGGVNEVGLAVEVLWLNESRPSPPDQRPYLNELEWIQYLLDTTSTVKGALKATHQLRISPLHGQVHYFMCDRGGACATIELLNGEVVVHTGERLPYSVLTNHTYQESLTHLKATSPTPEKGLPKSSGRGSLARFTTAARATKTPQPQTLTAALKALDQVKINGYTQWQIAYDLKRGEVLFKTSRTHGARLVRLDALIKRSEQLNVGEALCDSTLTYSLADHHKEIGRAHV